MTFDTFAFAEGLKSSGIPEEHVKALTQELTKALKSEDLATKQDIAAVKQDIKNLAAVTTKDIVRLEAKITVMNSNSTASMSEMKLEFIKWSMGMVFALSGIMFALLRFMLP